MSELRRVPVHRALNRPNVLLGGERELVLMTGIICFTLIVVAQTWIAFVLGIALWFVSIGFLRMMAKADPMMSRVYVRHIQFKSFYSAHSRPFRKE
ncbi:MAG: conjugal transfer protein TrbD [Deltaproteobacteria bacterium]|jgi:type IV secretion system protein VirB3|nr:conjugal transfer protein TrbD [Deltaproteobacteria bacterium]